MGYFRMAKLALKWAVSKPATVQYPFAPARVVPGSRGKLLFTPDNCVYCKVCGKKCPTNAIEVDRPGRQWILNRLACISCGECVSVCPKKSLELTSAHAAPLATKERESTVQSA
jgi:formate hydrogenlyase subunit 6/NADH:ubiquinone oxidoreductase subunit I